VARKRESLADQLYREQMGAAAFERQQALRREETSCSCGIGNAMAGEFHAPGCGAVPVAGYKRRFGLTEAKLNKLSASRA
jgi:hypothetical protein